MPAVPLLSDVLVDTGSMGLRVLSAAAGGAFSLALPQQPGAGGGAIVECNAFVDGYTWGPVKLALMAIVCSASGCGGGSCRPSRLSNCSSEMRLDGCSTRVWRAW